MESIQKKWSAYLGKISDAVKKAYQTYTDAEPGEKKKALRAYQKILRKYLLQNAAFNALLDELAEELTVVNEAIAAYVNEYLAHIFMEVCNGVNRQIMQEIVGYDPDMLELDLAELFLEEFGGRMEKQKASDTAYHKKQLSGMVQRGIIQGWTIRAFLDGITAVTDRIRHSAMRMVNTYVTRAENSARIKAYDDVISGENGNDTVNYVKTWVTMGDDRVRESHVKAKGQTVSLDTPFYVGNSLLMYPGDASGEACEICNCRCWIICRRA